MSLLLDIHGCLLSTLQIHCELWFLNYSVVYSCNRQKIFKASESRRPYLYAHCRKKIRNSCKNFPKVFTDWRLRTRTTLLYFALLLIPLNFILTLLYPVRKQSMLRRPSFRDRTISQLAWDAPVCEYCHAVNYESSRSMWRITWLQYGKSSCCRTHASDLMMQ
jgi:hypothetical protein